MVVAEIRARREALRRSRPAARVVRVFVASSSDVRDERERVKRVLERLHKSFKDELWFRPVMWEEYDTPSWQPPQAAVFENTRFDDIDLFIGIFWWRAGTPVDLPDGRTYPGGTFAELERARELHAAGSLKEIMLYICSVDPPPGHDPAQRTALQYPLRRIESTAFCKRYRTPDDFEAALREDLSNAVERHFPRPGGAPALPALVTKLCDRYEQESDFTGFFAEGLREHRGVPQACILFGARGEGHESFVERVLALRLRRAARQLWPELDVVTDYHPPWPEGRSPEEMKRRLKRLLFDQFHDMYLGADDSAAMLTALPAFRRSRVVVLHHEVFVTTWRSAVVKLLRWYLDEFWSGLPADPDRPEVLVIVKVIYAEPADARGEPRKAALDRIKRDLQSINAPTGAGCRRIVLPELRPVTPQDVKDWLDRYCDVPPELRAQRLAEQIFQTRGGPLASRSMDEVEDDLRELLSAYSISTRPLP